MAVIGAGVMGLAAGYHAVPGFVEFSRLRPTGDTIVFVPYYMPTSSARWAQRNDELIDDAFGYLKRVNPSLTDSDRIDAAAEPCPARLPARVLRNDPKGADADRGIAGRRHLLLLPRGPRRFGRRTLGKALALAC